MDTYDGRPIRSWLWGISRRIAGSHNRTEGRAGRRLSVAPAPTESPRPDEVAERNEAIAFVDRFLRQLDEDKRAVFQLAEIEGVSAPEIGEILGVKLSEGGTATACVNHCGDASAEAMDLHTCEQDQCAAACPP